MLTKQTIEIAFGNAQQQADQLEACADEMLRVANSNMETVKSDLASAWQGTSAEAYIHKMDLTAENIRKTAGRIQEIAKTLRSVAKVFRETELKALALATKREN